MQNQNYDMDIITEAQEIYDQLYIRSKYHIRSGKIDIDQHLPDKNSDHRRGISIILRPDEKTANEIEKFQKEMQTVDNGQYFQPGTDLHITVLSVITAYDGFTLSEIDSEQYSGIISESLTDQKKISISLQGVTCSAGAVMIQGFDKSGGLQLTRENLRKAFKDSEIEHSSDSRYTLKTAHITAIRFMQALKDPQSYDDLIKKYRNHYFGSFEVAELDFVFHDWYQTNETLQVLQKIRLHSND